MSVDTCVPRLENFSKGKCELDNGKEITFIDFRAKDIKKHDWTLFDDRLKTFTNWTNKNVTPEALASAGFYYLGEDDFVKCPFCGIRGHRWEAGDKPMEDHKKWNKHCPFIENSESTDDSGSTPSRSQDICGNNCPTPSEIEVFPNSKPEDQSYTHLEKLGIQKTRGPSHPDYHLYETRFNTFLNWPKSLKQKPVDLASAGFFYLGIGDQTLCFHCGGGLKDWEESDDPWEQHALWFPKCNYLLLKKGQEFVEQVQKKHTGEENKVEVASSEEVLEAATKDTVATLEADENKSEEGVKLCKICYKNELGVVFLPCGHMVACADCASALTECAVCRKPLQATVRAFLS